MLSVPALLPMYVLKAGKTRAAVNGQTGRVAVMREKKAADRSWMIEPSILTALAGIISFILIRDEIELPVMITAFTALLSFTAFGKGRGQRLRAKILRGQRTGAARESGRLVYGTKDAAPAEIQHTPVFFEEIDGREQPVRIRFYTPARLVLAAVLFAVLMTLPILIALGITALRSGGAASFRALEYSMNVIWLTLAAPCAAILWIALGRLRIYDYPALSVLLPDGRTRRCRDPKPRKRMRKDDRKILVVLLLASSVILAGTVLAILL